MKPNEEKKERRLKKVLASHHHRRLLRHFVPSDDDFIFNKIIKNVILLPSINNPSYFFKEMGWPPPIRCLDCRPARCLSCNSPLFMTRGEAKEREVTHCGECRRLTGLEEEEDET